MKQTSSFQLCLALLLLGGFLPLDAGTISYGAIPGVKSDPGSGISTQNTYTNAIDGGNDNAERVVNGVVFHPLVAEGQTATADHCTLNSLSGSLTNSRPAESAAVDGVMAEVLADTTMNQEAGDDSQQEVILDPAELQAGVTYDLRVYLRKADEQDRQINLAFAGDGQAPVETGFFNEDDATTSAGGFSAPDQAYYVNYRYTWDGDSVPGITVTQKKGNAPFNLYALTNQVVPAQVAAQPLANQTVALTEVAPANDKIGVSSDLFYADESLKQSGRWLEVGKYGTCWQPTGVPADWRPYTNGTWRHCDDAGWVWVTDEKWGWATYHYGRWFRSEKVGWCWVPGTVWAPSWVSWRQGTTEQCSCLGWAPLPPEATCAVGVGVSTWVDKTCDIGPDAYTFLDIRDLGSDSYSRCGCVYGRERNVTIIGETVNITNIVYNRNVTYCGGPDYGRCNQQIREHGGREVENLVVSRVQSPGALNGRYAALAGNKLELVAPVVKATITPTRPPMIAAKVPPGGIDRGWGRLKADPKAEAQLKEKIAQQTKGATPTTTVAKLTPDQTLKVKQAREQKAATGGSSLTGTVARLGQPGAKALGSPSPTNPGIARETGAKSLHPGASVKGIGPGATAPGGRLRSVGSPAQTHGAPTAVLHPGQSIKKSGGAGLRSVAGPSGERTLGAGTGNKPGNSAVSPAPGGTRRHLTGGTANHGSSGAVEKGGLPPGVRTPTGGDKNGSAHATPADNVTAQAGVREGNKKADGTRPSIRGAAGASSRTSSVPAKTTSPVHHIPKASHSESTPARVHYRAEPSSGTKVKAKREPSSPHPHVERSAQKPPAPQPKLQASTRVPVRKKAAEPKPTPTPHR